FADKGLVGRDAFLQAARDRQLLEEFGIGGESFEGYLYPDTYRFAENTTAPHIVRRMHERWKGVWKTIKHEHAESLGRLRQTYGFDRHDLVTLASLVEAETRLKSERPIVARVMLNRIDEGMRLQTDPTCVYGPDTYDKVPTPDLCNDPSNRYSTYVIDGLPPGPIGNPGRTSLAAALDPATGEDVEQ
ncbi:MAG: endolytic transglycosylase MltG, partial [Bradymonadaceae bacterium]